MQKENIDVLLIDDDQDLCLMINSILKYAKYNVKHSCVADNLHGMLANMQPRLILMDMLLSGTDGRDVCKLLKENDNTVNIQVMMMSAHPDAEISCKQAGANYFIAKPFDIDVFLNKIKIALND